jgi:hypothetical protein
VPAFPVTEPEIAFVTKRFVDVAFPRLEREAKRLVEEAVEVNRLVEVALVARKFAIVPRLVSEEAVIPAARVLPVRVPAGATTAFVDTAVTRPLPFTVNVGIAVEEPKEPVSVFTVARVVAIDVAPEPLTSPDSVIVWLPESLLLKVDQSAGDNRPLFDAEAVGMLKVIVSPAAVIEKSVPVVVVASVIVEPVCV